LTNDLDNTIQNSIIETIIEVLKNNEACKECPVIQELQNIELDAIQRTTRH
jgi:hypothetical protein